MRKEKEKVRMFHYDALGVLSYQQTHVYNSMKHQMDANTSRFPISSKPWPDPNSALTQNLQQYVKTLFRNREIVLAATRCEKRPSLGWVRMHALLTASGYTVPGLGVAGLGC
jgi:hypothetical protein